MAAKDRVAAHRERMRRAGFRQIQIWVPDTNSPEFAKAAREQSLAAAEFDRAHPEIQDYIDAMQAEVWDHLP